ncbi:MAG: AAA family ATPase [Armatimonadetes bacterium]|nr:AAA family ATPase [Armatimonadota bacterium]MDI9587338.1 AAA family ATPase [Acidobacteriota bacterium]
MIRIVVTEASLGLVDSLRRYLASSTEHEIVGYARDGLEAAQLAVQLAPDVLIVHEALPELSGFRVAELVSAAAPQVAVLLLLQDESPDRLRRAMAAGARGVAPENASPERLTDTIAQVATLKEIRQEPEFPLVTDPERMPISIAVTSTRGGAGKTTLAVNLAVAFANRFPDQVVLVDCHSQFSDAAVALNLSPHDSIVDLASFEELDPELVKTHLTVHGPSRLRLLAAPELPLDEEADLGRLNVHFMASLIGHLRRSYRFVFFDLPPLVWPTSEYILSRCQEVIIVTTLFDLAAIRNARSLVALARGAVGDKERVKLVLNRFPFRGDFSVQDLEETAGQKVFHQLPDDPETARGAFNKGIPVITDSPGSGLSRALVGLADKLQAQFAGTERRR